MSLNKRRFRVTGKTRYGHIFKVGQVVELVKIYDDGVFEVEGMYFGHPQKQDVHPFDLEEIFDEKEWANESFYLH